MNTSADQCAHLIAVRWSLPSVDSVIHITSAKLTNGLPF